MASEPHALFVADGDVFVPTELTRTGWGDDTQHGGAPCGLLASVIERVPAEREMMVTRLTLDLLRAVPMTPLQARINVVKQGRRVEVIDASLYSDEREVARARALRIRVGHVPLPDSPLDPWASIPAPEDTPSAFWPSWEHGEEGLVRFHRDAIEVRTFDESFWTPGRGVSWIRLACPVISGEPISPLVRTAALSDVANGNAMALDPRLHIFVNPDITLYLHRPLEGEWLGMDGVAYQHDSGIGLTDTLLFDARGPLGRVNQSQLLDAHA